MQNHKNTSQKILQQIKQAQNVLLISHRRPDGDTIGSNLAFYNYLKNSGKNVTSFCIDSPSSQFDFLPEIKHINNDPAVLAKKYDIVITVDCASLDYAGVDKLLAGMDQNFVLINIDHHVSNPLYGDINLVIAESSSTAEVVYRLFRDWAVDINKNIATYLSMGMITDTEGFQNPGTTYQSLAAHAELIKRGAKIHEITRMTLKNNDISQLKLWGVALSRLTKVKKYNLVYTYLTEKDLVESGASEEATEGLANFLHILKEGKIILVLREMGDNIIKGSLRTTTEIDLAKLAACLGGGGHKKAAGFSLPGKLLCDKNILRIE